MARASPQPERPLNGAESEEGAGEACGGPHLQCQGCLGNREAIKETLYVSGSGQATGVAAAHRCWHCHGSGYYCRAAPPCHPPHSEPE